MKHVFAPALAALGLALTTLPAQAQTGQLLENPNEIVNGYSATALTPILDALGRTYTIQTSDDGIQYLEVNSEQGLPYLMIPAACGDTGTCLGLKITATFSQGVPPGLIMLYDYNQDFVSAGLNPDTGETFVTRYELSQFGTPKGNIVSSLVNFETALTLFVLRIQQIQQAAADEAGTAPIPEIPEN